jgi:putative sigma-54 modulation protein
MEFEFTGRHIDITPAIERLVRKELNKLNRVLDSAPMRAHVILSSEKHRQRSEIVVHWRDSVFTGVAENSDLKQSIATAASKVEKQVLRLKDKFHAKKRGRTSMSEVAPVPGGAIEAARALELRHAAQGETDDAGRSGNPVGGFRHQFIVFGMPRPTGWGCFTIVRTATTD